jgi:general secretion pathway protein H
LALPSGFTLIEMIIVLVVLGLVAGLVISRGPSRSPTVAIRSAATQLLQAMRSARAEAIAAGQPAAFSVADDQRSFRVGTAAPRPLPYGVTARIEIAGRPAPSIQFQPDGSSTGGAVLVAGSTRRMSVTVDWLSGRMRIAEPAP